MPSTLAPRPPAQADGPPPSGNRPVRLPPRRPSPDAWPHTGRLLPWLIAVFLVVVLVTPFDSTELRVGGLPVDAKLDRLFILVITATGIGTYFAGGTAAPRWRRSGIGLAILAFVGLPIASLLINAGALIQGNEMSLGMRKLSILLSWAVLFFVVATSIRPHELRAFGRLVVIAACVTAVGVLWEYMTGHNLFFDWWKAIVPDSTFNVRPEPTTTNQFVKQPVTGPRQHALAMAAAM